MAPRRRSRAAVGAHRAGAGAERTDARGAEPAARRRQPLGRRRRADGADRISAGRGFLARLAPLPAARRHARRSWPRARGGRADRDRRRAETLPADLSAALATRAGRGDRAGAPRRRAAAPRSVAIDTGLAGVHDAGTALRLDDVPLPVRALVPGPPAAATVVKALSEAVVTGRQTVSCCSRRTSMRKAWMAAAALVVGAAAGGRPGAGRQDGDRQRLEGDGRRRPQLDHVLRVGRQLRPRPVEQRQRRVAAHQPERLRARDRLRLLHVAGDGGDVGGAGHRPGGRAGAVPAEHRRGAGQLLGAAARDLDDAVGLSEGRRGQQRHRARRRRSAASATRW